MNVVVLGASDDPEKYSHKAVVLLKEKGHAVFPVNPSLKTLEGLQVYPSISDVPQVVDTISLYVSPNVSSKIGGDILNKSPRRIIFNPGAENPELEARAKSQGITALNACTLVLLRTNQFDRKA